MRSTIVHLGGGCEEVSTYTQLARSVNGAGMAEERRELSARRFFLSAASRRVAGDSELWRENANSSSRGFLPNREFLMYG